MKRSAALLVPLALTLGLAACGDDDDDGGGASGGDSDWCDLARDVEAQDDIFDDVDFTDPDAMRTAFERATSVLEDAADEAPEEIEDDVQTTLNAFQEYREALEDADYDIMNVDTAVFESIGEDAEAAGDRISEYNERVCGIPADGDTDSTEPAGDDTDSTEPATDDGTDDGTTDDGTTDDGTTSDATLPAGGTLNDILVDQFTAMGMTEDEAQCLVDTIDIQEFSQSQDVTQLMEAFDECGIDPTELGG